MAHPNQITYRTQQTVAVVEADPAYEPLRGFYRPEGNQRCCAYSPCGRYIAYASVDSVTVSNASKGDTCAVLPAENVFELGFSPLGTFIITWQRPGKDENGDASKNLKVWSVLAEDGEDTQEERSPVGKFVQKSQTGWNLQYTYDERYCARVVNNEVQFFESGDLGKVWNRLLVKAVTDFALSPGKNHTLAIFIPERKGLPAAVKTFNVPDFDAPVSQKSFFKGDKVQLKWNDEGSSLIVLAQTEVDKSGKSYYGETTLYLMSASGNFDSRIDLDKDGPIHDVTWSSNSKEFGVVYGYMPSKTTIFDDKANVTHTFPLAPRNTISFSPHGRFVIVAGFGNLAGDVDVFDTNKNYQKICTIQASNASVCEWSPDERFILTAIISPRLRVDNGVRIWHVGGTLMYNEDLTELYHVTWRPQSTSTSSAIEDPLDPVPSPHESARTYLGTVKTPSKPAGAYRPPGARGQVTPIAFKREDQGGTAYVSDGSLSQGLGASSFGKPRRREIPGAEMASDDGGVTAAADDENLSKAAAKNKKKREAKKAKDAAEKAAGLAPPTDGVPPRTSPSPARSPDRRDRKSHERNRSRGSADGRTRSNHLRQEPRRPDQRRPAPAQTPVTNGATHKPPNTTPQAPLTGHSQSAPEVSITSQSNNDTPQAKKIRALRKKLRAIDELKMKRAKGEKLEGTQIMKMDTEREIFKELESLGWTGET